MSTNLVSKEPVAQGVVSATYVLLLFDYLEELGLDACQVLGGDKPELNNGVGRVPVTQWQRQLQLAAIELNDPLLGLHLGERISPRHFGLLGYVLLACGNVASALQRLQQYHQLIYDVNPLQVNVADGQLTLAWGVKMGRPGALVDETAVASMLQFCRDITGRPNVAPLAVSFVNAQPTDCKPFEQWFGCPVQFEQAETQVTIASELLNAPLRSADPALMSLLEKQADELLLTLANQETSELITNVRQRISHLLHSGEPNAEQIASQLHVTSRTLHRRLAADGESFRQLLQQTRHHLAKEYLADPRLQLAEIALLLGYSEQSALSRAFKQWQGVTLNQYRQSL